MSTTFKDLVASDIKEVFLKTSEFSSTHTVNGIDMPALIDDNEEMERKSASSANAGIFVNSALMYVSAADYGEPPNRGAIIVVDSKKWSVISVTQEQGMYAISMEKVLSNARAKQIY